MYCKMLRIFKVYWKYLFDLRLYAYVAGAVKLFFANLIFCRGFEVINVDGGARVFFDLSRSYDARNRSGIPRVVRSLFYYLLKIRHDIVPVYVTLFNKGVYLLEVSNSEGGLCFRKTVKRIALRPGDVFISFDASRDELLAHSRSLMRFSQTGGVVIIGIHDIFPITNPEWFKSGRGEVYLKFIETFKLFARFVCISSSTRKILLDCFPDIQAQSVYKIQLGSDLAMGRGLKRSECSNKYQSLFRDGNVYIMVGTIEPRKNISYVISCFNLMWARGSSSKLIIVGARGWLADDVIWAIENSLYYQKQLFWLKDVDDSQLECCYSNATALIVASLNEGFCLPIAEALSLNCPVLANNIAVFHDVFGDKIEYFDAGRPCEDFVESFELLVSGAKEKLNSCQNLSTWADSARELSCVIDAVVDRSKRERQK